MDAMPNRIPPLDDLYAFAVVARRGSFRHAAEELNVTPSAISHRIRDLELRLGRRLFDRLTRRVELTPDGARLAAGILESFDRIGEAVAALSPAERNPGLNVSALSSLTARWLVPRLADFHARHPGISLNLSAEDRLSDLSDRNVDLAIRFGSGTYPGLHAERLAGDRAFPVCSPAYAHAHPLNGLDDLRRVTLIHDVAAGRDGSGADWGSWLKGTGLKADLDGGPRFSHAHLAIQAAVEAHGIAMARASLVVDDLAAGRLTRPFGHSVPTRFAYYTVCRPEMAQHPRILAFRSWLSGAVDWNA